MIVRLFHNCYKKEAFIGKISGIKMAKMLKADVTTANIPIIFCTARDTEYDMIMGLNLGADDYIRMMK